MVTVAGLKRAVNAIRRQVEGVLQADRTSARLEPSFGLCWMKQILPHYLKSVPSRFHLELASDLGELHRRRGSREVRVAPRGSGKSSWSTKGYGLYCGLEGIEKHILILSETMEQACQFVEDIGDEIEANPAVQRYYPDVAGKGPIWQRGRLKLRNGVLIRARGVGGKIRGLSNKSDRPSLVIVDDPNGDDDAFSPTKRRRKLTWFTKAVLNMGDPKTNVLVLGTPIHRDVIVCQLRDGELSPGWNSKSYRSIIRWPDRMDLWSEWEQLRSNLGDPDRTAKSDRFFDVHREAMLRGSEVLWPDWEPFEHLMKHRASVGPAAFDCEKQDKPGREGAAEWPPEYFEHGSLWFDRWPDTLARVQVLDPSKGAGDKPGDFQAVVHLGLAKDGTLLAEASLAREDPSQMISRCLDLYAMWQPDVWCAEDNGTMGLLQVEVERQLSDRAKAGKPMLVNFEAYTSMDAKSSRIRFAGAYLARRQIRFRNTPGGRMLVEQLRDWPNGDHDDGPDALGVAIRRLEILIQERYGNR